MATGVVNSRTLNTSQPGVLRLGEQQASTVEALKDKNSKTYKHQLAGARFIMPDGLELHFLGGTYTTNVPEQIAELDKVANKVASGIYTEAAAAAALAQTDKAASDGAANTAGTLPADA